MYFSKKYCSACISLVLAACVLTHTAVPLTAAAEKAAPSAAAPAAIPQIGDYEAYMQSVSDKPDAQQKIVLHAADFTENTTGSSEISGEYGEQEAFIWSSGTGALTYETEIPETALYTFSLCYATLAGNGMDIQLGLMIDGAYPFQEAEAFLFPRMWKNAQNVWQQNEKGDDLTPEQEEYRGAVSWLAKDSTGVAVRPYTFLLTAGRHKLTLAAGGEPFVLIGCSLLPPEHAAPYRQSAPSKEQLAASEQTEPILLQGEKADLKTGSAILPRCDNTNVSLTPASAVNVRMNYLGGSWSSPNQSVSWSFQVKQDGYYKLGFYFKQDQVINSESYRWLKIDGKTPCAEAENIAFGYASGWQFQAFSDEQDEPYYIWLTAGDHILSMETTLGSIAPYYRRLAEIAESLGDEYTKIVWITGDTPDVNRDYELFHAIPDFEQTLRHNMDALNQLAEDMQKLTGKRSSQYIASMKNMARVLRLMIERPYIAHQYLNDYYSNYCTVTAWLNEMAKTPLALDEIQLVPCNSAFDRKQAGVFARIGFWFQRLMNSFMQDYDTGSGARENTTLRLWVTWGRDQMRVLGTLIQDSFTPQYGIDVKVEMVNATLIQGIMSGNAPDAAIQLARSEPVNLGIRNALYDLRQFDDLEQMLERFQSGAELPYCYDGKCYALPDTQTFYSLFYRMDVLKELELEAPNTWEEFIQASVAVQRKNMQVYLPYTRIAGSGTVNGGIGSLNLLPTLLMQHGLSIYNDEQTAAVLDTPQAISVFDKWTEFYTDYNFLKEADFYNRFRAGTIPMGIAPYTTYMTLEQTAPELKGRWAMAPVPSADGKNHTVAGGGSGCGILSATKHPDAAWTFLKWWTSAETQERFSKNMESVLGLVGRVATSNKEAFQALSWEPDCKAQLLAQWSQVKELPEIPGSYYLSRAVDQAYWQVVNGESNAIDAVSEWNEVANQEISRKVREYKALRER